MPFSHALADRIRRVLGVGHGIVEKKMFGGLCFMLDGKLLVGIMGSSLIVRLGPDEAAVALQDDSVRVFDITGRPMKNWVVVEPDGLDSDRQLSDWLERATRFVEGIPAKTDSASPQRRRVAEKKGRKKKSGSKKKGERGT
jgi:hypothetical protein